MKGWRLMCTYKGVKRETDFKARRGDDATPLEVAAEIMAMQPRAPALMLRVAQGKSRGLASRSTIGDEKLSPKDQASKLMKAVRFKRLAPFLKTIMIVRAEHDTANFEITSHDGAVYFFKEYPDTY